MNTTNRLTMHSKKQVIAAAPLLLSLAAFTQEALAVTDIKACQTISQSGSYRLTKNLSAKGDCLVVTANRVEIDLQGHTIRGDGTGAGVQDDPNSPIRQFAITVRNGTIGTFRVGVQLGSTTGVVEQLHVVESGDIGIILSSGRVRSNVVFDVGVIGIFVPGGAAVVSDNFVSQVGTTGIAVGPGSSVVGNSVSQAGANGVSAGCPSRVTDNSVAFFEGVAISTFGLGCSVQGNASN